MCGLGQTAANPVFSTMSNFKEEYIEHVTDKVCRAHVCKAMTKFEIDKDKCKKCSLCARNCPVGAIFGEVGKVPYEINQDKCIKCGACMSSCRFNAIYKR